MRSRTNLTLIIIVAAFTTVCFTSYCLAAAKKSPALSEPSDPNLIPFPYIAEITEDNVNIRSGAGTNFYSCGKLNKGDKVEVVSTQLSWSQVVPPPSCSAWVSKQYVTVEPNEQNVGVVTAEAVRVYAASTESSKPIHSTTVLVKLNRGDKVSVLGQAQGDYLKIAPPAGSFLWISTNYTKPIGPASSVTLPTTPAIAPTILSTESKKLEEYYALEKQLKTEKEKPLEQQSYEALKKAFVEIAGSKEAGKAMRCSESAIRQIEQCELAQRIAKETELQDSQFQQIRQSIEQARAAKLAQLQDLSSYAAIGRLQPSNIFSEQEQTKRYRLVDESSGKIICYAEPAGPALGIDLAGFMGKQVGLVGTIEPLPQVSGALVKFTEVAEVK